MMKDSIKVLMAGSDISVKGGMTTVVKSFLNHRFSPRFNLTYIPTHSEHGKIYNSLFFLKGYFAFICFLVFRNPDLVHLHMSDKGSFFRKYILFKTAKAYSKPVIIHAHGGDFRSFYMRMPKLVKGSIRDMLKNADKVLALGSNWQKVLTEIEPETDILVLTNSVPLPELQITKVKTGFNILFLAVVNKSKGIFDLIEAAERLDIPQKKFVIDIAGDGEVLEEAKLRVEKAGMEGRFRFHGWVGQDRKKELLLQADLFVLPSYFEGMPMSILEAVSYGKPVLATDVGSINEAVIHGENGYLMEPGDVEALAYYLNKLMLDAELVEKGMASRRIAEEHFDEKYYFQKVENLYSDCSRRTKFQVDRNHI